MEPAVQDGAPVRKRKWTRQPKDGTRICPKCDVRKSQADFSRGTPTYCKPCQASLTRAWLAAHPGYQRKALRSGYVLNWARRALVRAKLRAEELGVPFDMTVDDLSVPETCPVLGIPIQIGTGCSGPNSPSVDRLVPELGYVRGNVCVISMRANAIKNDASPEELERVLTWLRLARAGQCAATEAA